MKSINVYLLKRKLLLLFGVLFFNVSIGQTWQLSQCLDTALKHNNQLKISNNNLKISNLKNKEAQSNLLPKVQFNADYKYYNDLPTQLMPMSMFGGPAGQFKETQFGVPHNLNINLQIQLPLYNPQVYSAMKMSNVAEELSQLQHEKTTTEVFYNVSNLYYNAQIIANQMQFTDSNLLNLEQLQLSMQLLYENSLLKSSDVEKVKLQVEQMKLQKEILNSKYLQTISFLKLNMGLNDTVAFDVNKEIIFEPLNSVQSTENIDVKIVDKQSFLVNTELKNLRLSRLPTLSAYGSYGTMGYGFGEEPNNFLNFYDLSFVGVQLSIPIFNGTSLNKKISQKKLELDNTAWQKNLVSQTQTNQIDNWNRQKNIAFQSAQTAQKQIDLAENIYNQTALQQKNGTATLTEVLLAENAVREAQQLYLSAVIDYLKADLELKKLASAF